MRRVLLSLLILLGGAPPALAEDYSNVTVMYYDRFHGTQVEYYDAAESNYLWYPGNRVVLPGHWQYQRGTDGSVLICHRYGRNTSNPVTGTSGGDWECGRLAEHDSRIVEQKKGDVFDLAGRRSVPFVLTPGQTTIAALRKGAGGAAEMPAPSAKTPAPDADSSATLSVPADVTNPDCAAILAGANKGRVAKIQAALLYYHGTRMGKKCVKVDYVKAFALLREAGDGSNFNTLLADLRQKAESGNPRATAALDRIDTSPF